MTMDLQYKKSFFHSNISKKYLLIFKMSVIVSDLIEQTKFFTKVDRILYYTTQLFSYRSRKHISWQIGKMK